MDQKFFGIPFANGGDRDLIPDQTQVSGAVSYTQGYGVDYQRDITTDPLAKPIERKGMNGLFYAITAALRQYQVVGYPEWITPANNGGGAFAYDAGVIVRYDSGGGAFVPYVSLVSNNTAEPGTDPAKWQQLAMRMATSAEVTAGTDTTTWISPALLKAALSGVTVQDATEQQKGVVRLATEAETAAGTSNLLAVDPLRLYSRLIRKADVLNPLTTGMHTHQANVAPGGASATVGRLQFNDGVRRWDKAMSGDGNLFYVGYNNAGSNGYNAQILYAQPTARGGGNCAAEFGADIYINGRPVATYLADQTYTSTTRYATQAEVNAVAATNLGVSPATLYGFTNGRYLEKNNPVASGILGTFSGAVGVQSAIFRGGFNNLITRYAEVIEADGSFSLYIYDAAGGNPRRAYNCPYAGAVTLAVGGDISTVQWVYAGAFRINSSARWKNLERAIDGDEALGVLAKIETWHGRFNIEAFKADHGGEAPGAGDSPQLFYVAENLHEHAPQVVGYDEQGRPASVDYAQLSPYHTAAINALRAQNEEQARRIAALENTINQLIKGL